MIQPAFLSIKDTGTRICAGKTTVFDLISKGVLDARKIGAKTVITTESVDRLIESLPPAKSRPKAKTDKHAA